MYATVTRYQARPGALPEVERIWREQVGAQVRNVPGVGAVHLLADPTTGAGLIVVLWESQSAVGAYLQSDQRDAIWAAVADLLTGPSVPPEGYDVLFSSITRPPSAVGCAIDAAGAAASSGA